MSSHSIQFPKDFLWGAATSSFQIEGSPLADGACESNWYQWTHLPGKIADGSNADLACDHYHRYKEDVGLMKELGLKTYRFSLSWPRIVPERGRINEKGLDFYKRLLEELHKAGIVPNATLFHWEVPSWAKGSWEDRETALAFAEYASEVFKRLGKDVPIWATQNESLVTAHLGYLWGYFSPGKEDRRASGVVNHHLNLGHGLAVQAFRQGGYKGEIGVVAALGPFRTVTGSKEDEAWALKMKELSFGAFLDPLVGRGYPPFFFEFTGLKPSDVEKDLAAIAQPLDFLGVNHYFPNYAKHVPGSTIFDNDFTMPPGSIMNDMDWPIVPDAFTDLLVDLHQTYGFKKLYVTENGLPTRDSLRDEKQTLEDDMRVHYYGHYLAAAKKAIDAGVPLKGYYAWSLMDNFEWNHGFDPRFGLIHVDFKTLKRTFKKSAHWYKKVIAEGGYDLDALPKAPPFRVFQPTGGKARNF